MNPLENIGSQFESDNSKLSRFMKIFEYMLMIGIAGLFCEVLYHYIGKIGG